MPQAVSRRRGSDTRCSESRVSAAGSKPYPWMLAMDVDERDNDFDAERDTASGAAEDTADEEPQPLARVRYGLGKELLLFPDALVVHLREEREETRYHLASMRRLILMPGEHNPAKLVLMVELDDGTTVIAAEGVSNVRGFRVLLARLREIAPTIERSEEHTSELQSPVH